MRICITQKYSTNSSSFRRQWKRLKNVGFNSVPFENLNILHNICLISAVLWIRSFEGRKKVELRLLRDDIRNLHLQSKRRGLDISPVQTRPETLDSRRLSYPCPFIHRHPLPDHDSWLHDLLPRKT